MVLSCDRDTEDTESNDDEEYNPRAFGDANTVGPGWRSKDSNAGENEDNPVEK